MIDEDDEQELRAVALQNAAAILAARQRAEQELVRAKEALEARTRQLARSLALTRATLEATTDGILVADEHGTVTDFNERYLTLWGVARGAVAASRHQELAARLAERVADREAFLRRIDEIYATSPAESFDAIELSDGRVLERYSRTQVVDGRTVGRVWSVRDVTDERRAQERERAARREAERASAMKDDFLATLSHELRTPLTAILGWSQTLRLPAAGPDELRRGLESIERNARAQTQLIEDLLDMSRIASGTLRIDLQPLVPAAVVEAAVDTVRAAADAKAIRLDTSFDPNAGPVAGDAARLQQVVWNLLSNAIKFTPGNGRILVRVERAEPRVAISVEDTGIGIPPEFLPHVFDRFRQADASSTRSAGGLGLGLAIVKQLVELHGGAVRAESRGLGAGSTFTVELPLLASPERIAPGARPAASVPFRRADLTGLTVVVVDDEPDAREIVAMVLAECGADVVAVADADEALEAIERRRPHVLVSDIGMPNVDGYELLRLVRALGDARGGGVPAIALTAYARAEDRTRALDAGYLLHVAKPVEPSDLVETVARVSGRRVSPSSA